MSKDVLKDNDHKLCVLLWQTRDALFKARQNELRQFGVTISEASVLFFVSTIGPNITPMKISQWLFREPQSVSELINRMRKKGLVVKTKDLKKKNMVRISLTEKGKEIYKHTIKTRFVIKDILNCLSDEEKQQLWTLLDKVRNRAIEDLKLKHKPPYP
jgi:DNA-binding MarR family transcriptional regulator